MNKIYYFSSILIVVSVTIFFSCDSSTSSYSNSPSDTSQTQKVLIWAEHNNDSIPYTDIEGIIMSDNMRELQLNYIQIEDTKFINYVHQGNYLSFSDFRIYSPPETMQIEAKTSQGTLTGQTTLPQKPTNIKTNLSDTIGLTDSLQISWVKVQADGYNLIAGYYYTIEEDTIEGLITKNKTIDTTVYSNSITLPSNKFQHDGILYDLNIISINTPGENEGEEGFMKTQEGIGEGYIYYLSDEVKIAKNIIIGEGTTNQDLSPQTINLDKRNFRPDLKTIE